jgi:hypothetical protein
MLELYFLIYRIPKMMTRLARERNRSAMAWSLIGIGAWLAAEMAVGFAVGFVHAIGILRWGWQRQSSGFSILTYVLALSAALISVTIVSRLLTRKPREQTFRLPPPPPEFQASEQSHGE